eukprot:jgi/Orpsp1_1/1183483/evm.model.c7180000085407.1
MGYGIDDFYYNEFLKDSFYVDESCEKIKTDYYDIIKKIENKDLFTILKNMKKYKKIYFKDLKKQDILIILYTSAIERQNLKAIEYLNKKYDIYSMAIDFEMYYRDLLSMKALRYFIKNGTDNKIKKNHIKISSKLISTLIQEENNFLLDEIFKSFRIFDNEIIIDLCYHSKFKIPLSEGELNNKVNNDKYKITCGDNIYEFNYLFDACKYEKEYIVKFLVNHGIDVNREINFTTPLTTA